MVVGLCTVELRLPDGHSLKAKRQVLSSLKARLRGRFNISVAEVGDQLVFGIVEVFFPFEFDLELTLFAPTVGEIPKNADAEQRYEDRDAEARHASPPPGCARFGGDDLFRVHPIVPGHGSGSFEFW